MSSRRPVAPRAIARPAEPAEPSPAGPSASANATAVDVLDREEVESSGTDAPAERSARARRSRRVRARASSRPDRGATPARPDRRSRAGRAASERTEEERPPRTVTMRTLVLGLVVLVAFIVLAPTARAFIVQTEHLRRVAAESAAVDAQVMALQDQLERWGDVSYVRAQARERLGFVLPGETPYRVVDPQTVPSEDGGSFTDLEAAVNTAPQVPWYLTLRDSVAAAGEEPGDEPDYRMADPTPTPTP